MKGQMVYLGRGPQAVAQVREMNLERATRDWYGEKAQTYDEGRDTDPKWLAENEGVMRFLADAEGPVLDIPCGTGRYFGVYEKLGLEYAGLDVSEEMLAIAKKKFPKARIGKGNITSIPVLDRSYPTVVCIRLLEKLNPEEFAAAIDELCRVTSKRLIFNAITGKEMEARNRSWRHLQSVLEGALKRNGFRLVDAHTVRDPEYYVWLAMRVKDDR